MDSTNQHQTIIVSRQLLSAAEGAGLLALSCPLALWSFSAIVFGGIGGLWWAALVLWSLFEIVRMIAGVKSPRQRLHSSLRRLALSLISAAVVVWGVGYGGVLTTQLAWFLLGLIPVFVSCFYHLLHRDAHDHAA
jgi:hypothetical protein